MMMDNIDYVCSGFGMGGLNPGSDAFCLDKYKKIRLDKNIGSK